MARRSNRTEQRQQSAAAPRGKRRKRRVRAQRATILLRWCVLATAGLVAFLYYQPLSSYLETRSALNERAAEVQTLREERARLQARLADSATVEALSREARRMSLVRPGETLFIVKGIEEWRKVTRKAGTTTIGRNG